MSITVYTKNDCVQCKMTKRFLDAAKADYETINIDEQPEHRDQLIADGFKAMPVIKSDGVAFSGFNPSKLKEIVG